VAEVSLGDTRCWSNHLRCIVNRHNHEDVMLIDSKYDFGSIVYMVADREQLPRVVTGFLVQPIGTRVEVSSPAGTVYCYEFELSSEKNVLSQY